MNLNIKSWFSRSNLSFIKNGRNHQYKWPKYNHIRLKRKKCQKMFRNLFCMVALQWLLYQTYRVADTFEIFFDFLQFGNSILQINLFLNLIPPLTFILLDKSYELNSTMLFLLPEKLILRVIGLDIAGDCPLVCPITLAVLDWPHLRNSKIPISFRRVPRNDNLQLSLL